MADKINRDALSGLDKLIGETQVRLAANPDYIALKAFEKARAEILGIKGAAPTPAPMVPLHTVYSSTGHPGDHGDGKKVSQLAGAAQSLETAGHPLSAQELMEGAIKAGAVITSNNPLVSFGSSLSKSDKFKSVRWKGKYAWWFSDRPLPAALSRKQARDVQEAAE
jgi:hypothetical protein